MASNFGTAALTGRNIITITKPFKPSSNIWYIKTKFVTPDNVVSVSDFCGSASSVDFTYPIMTIRDGFFKLYLSSNGTSWNIASNISGTHSVQPNTEYWVVFGYNGSEYYLDYSLDGVDYTRDITISSALPIYNSNYLFGIGNHLYSTSAQEPFLGTIDLYETKIYINNDLFWEYKDGSITLPKDSKIYIVDNGEIRAKIIEEDVVNFEKISDGSYDAFIFYDEKNNKLEIKNCSKEVFSGSSDVRSVHVANNGDLWFDEESKTYYEYIVDAWVEVVKSLPLGKVKIKDSIIVELYETFNGIGHIGSVVYMLPGVEYFVADGKNASLTNINDKQEIKEIVMGSISSDRTYSDVVIFSCDDNKIYRTYGYDLKTSLNVELDSVKNNSRIFWKDENNNQLHHIKFNDGTIESDSVRNILIGNAYYDNEYKTNIKSLEISKPFTIHNYEEVGGDYVVSHGCSSDGSVWYRVYKSGWIEQGGSFGSAYSAYTTRTFQFPVSFRTTNYSAFCHCAHTADITYPSISGKTKSSVTFWNTYNTSSFGNWYACGY